MENSNLPMGVGTARDTAAITVATMAMLTRLKHFMASLLVVRLKLCGELILFEWRYFKISTLNT